ncbi:MAG: methyl-accepting chemotaxis protein, partial [Burkholderiales bacterium]|nr:methyl-accepting chemotaxis protein [Burkholderiales bacterium]
AQLDQATQQNAALVEESAAAAESLREQSRQLTAVVAAFSTGASGPRTDTRAGTSAALAQQAIGHARQAPARLPKAAAQVAPTRPAAVPVTAGKAADDDWESF